MVIKAIIFDFDGTLANTLPICYYAFQSVFREFDHKELSANNEIKAMFGPSETGIIRENLIHENKEAAVNLFYSEYFNNHSYLVKSNDKINNLLHYLKDSGVKIGIFTGKAKRSLDISLKSLQMDDIFDVIITGDDVVKPKPDPEGLIKALSLLNIDKTEAIFIGDSDADILAGLEADVCTVGVRWLPDYQTAEFTNTPNAIFHSVSELLDYIKVGVTHE